MTASELRLGNKFYLPNGEVGTISYHEIRLMIVALDKPNYQPIPLTEEWLLKLGFEKVKGGISFDKGKLSIYLGDTILSGKNGRTYFNSWAILEESPKYIHQLQNLYFALTGEELNQQEQ